MTDRDWHTRSPLVIAEASDQRFPAFSSDVLGELAEFGEHREMAAGDTLYRAGEARWDFYVLIEGEVEVVRDDETQRLVVVYGPGQFVGELGLLTGQRTYLTARVTRNSLVLVIPHDSFRRLMATKPTISDTIFRALIGRRETLRTTSGGEAVQIIGSRFSRDALALRTFAARNRLAYAWIDLEEADDVGVLLASRGLRPSDTPVVITPNGILRHPTPGQFAEQLGLTYHPIPGRTFDLVVIGVGPAGLAASVYGASEGLDTVSLDAVAQEDKPVPAPASRTMRDFQMASRAVTLQPERPSRPSDWERGWLARVRFQACVSRTDSKSFPSSTKVRYRRELSSSPRAPGISGWQSPTLSSSRGMEFITPRQISKLDRQEVRMLWSSVAETRPDRPPSI